MNFYLKNQKKLRISKMKKESNSKEVRDTIIKASKVFIDTLEKEEEEMQKGK